MSENRIKCPKCGNVFDVDEAGYANIVKQVRDSEFNKELDERVCSLNREHAAKIELAKKEAVSDLEKENLKLKADLESAQNREKDFEKQKETEIKLAREEAKNDNIEQLKEKDEKIIELKSMMATSERLYEDKIAQIKDFNERLSTKMIGESLENYCKNEFEKIRAISFPNAYFGKDNEVSASSSSKGDFIFRDLIDGIESSSIMIECKNEEEETIKKQKNEKFFKELDKDRREKKCEYAILVSTLEKDSELYNQGIVSVSHLYPKMFVIRPQFFISMINIIALSARQSIEAKKDLELAKKQNIDLTNFEDNVKDFISGWQGSVKNATKKHEEAIKGIDKIIESLKKVRDALELSDKHLSASESKLEKLTVKKLTKNAPSVAEKLEEIRKDKES